jgi:hypothetical protein
MGLVEALVRCDIMIRFLRDALGEIERRPLAAHERAVGDAWFRQRITELQETRRNLARRVALGQLSEPEALEDLSHTLAAFGVCP